MVRGRGDSCGHQYDMGGPSQGSSKRVSFSSGSPIGCSYGGFRIGVSSSSRSNQSGSSGGEIRKLRVGLGMDDQEALLATLYMRTVLVKRILAAQSQDPLICTLRWEVENGASTDYSVRNDGALMVGTRLYVPNDKALKREILEEAHCSAFAMQLDSTKMYRTLREHYWWSFMKKQIAEYVSVVRFGKQGKLSPHYIGPYDIVEQPVQILDWKMQVLRSREIPLVSFMEGSYCGRGYLGTENQMRD
ncbi:hypothetical protein L3X38_025294 [Prunus dulcis]|uniref:Integrase zinc-binding domain-containing protein n=1 Tax=Prunus dulcis TaxID=3755 RepID=A0AAD4W3Z2_PRUDU|nr:hypothetical protein L3X38_025294 [Prunus dulcis]